MKRKLTTQLTVMVTVLLIFFALVVTVIFSNFTNGILVEHHQEVITQGVENVASTLTKMLPAGCTKDNFLETIQTEADMPYLVELMQGITHYHILLTDEDQNVLTLDGESFRSPDEPALAKDILPVVEDVFAGSVACRDVPNANGREHLLTGGAPIYSKDGDVIGAMLIRHRSSDAVEVQNQINQVLFTGSVTGLLISLVFLIIMTTGFTKPIKRIEYVANQLARGNLDIHTNIRSENELGQLAASMDELARQLLKAKENSENEDRLRNHFLADISHDLKTPVTVIRGSVEALCDGVVTAPEEVAAYHRQMLTESCHLQKLIQDLLELTSLKNREFKRKQEPVSLSDAMGDAAMSSGPVALNKGVLLHCQPPQTEYLLTGDYDLICKLFGLLLDNAIKYTPAGKSVYFYQEDLSRDIIIRDEGCGIKPEDIPYIFDRFFRSGESLAKGSSGLGLAIAKEIAERHRITLLPESIPGEGTCFRIHFPEGELYTEQGPLS